MLRCIVPLAAVLAMVQPPILSAPAPDAASTAPAIVARLQPLDRIFEDAKFLAGKLGKPEAAKELEEKVLQTLGIENLSASGIDIKKPIGAYVFVAPDWAESTAVAMLPVADEKAILKLAGQFQVKADRIEDGFYSLALPDWSLPLFVRFSGGYAYLAAMHKEALAVERLLPPARVFTGADSATLAISARPDLIPEPAWKSLSENLVEQINEFAGDEDSDFAKATIRLCRKWLEMFQKEGREATLQLSYERATGELTFDLGLTPKSGTAMAVEVAAFQPNKSLFTKLIGSAGAINYLFNCAVDGELARSAGKQFRDAGEDLFDFFELKIDDEKAKEEFRKVFIAIAPTIEAGAIDAAFTARGPGEKHYTGLFGLKLKDGRTIEEQLKKAVAALPKEQRDMVRFEAEKIGDTTVHSFKSDDDDEDFTKIFGNSVMYFAFRDDAVVLGFGEQASKAVAESLSALTPQAAPAFQLDVTGGKLKQFCDAFDDSVYGIVQRLLGTEDRVRIVAGSLEGGASIRVKMAISLQTIVGAMFLGVEGIGG